MKTALYTLALPVLWILQIGTLCSMVMMHIVAAPFRAFVYWGRRLRRYPGWRGFCNAYESEIGIGIPKEENSGYDQG